MRHTCMSRNSWQEVQLPPEQLEFKLGQLEFNPDQFRVAHCPGCGHLAAPAGHLPGSCCACMPAHGITCMCTRDPTLSNVGGFTGYLVSLTAEMGPFNQRRLLLHGLGT